MFDSITITMTDIKRIITNPEAFRPPLQNFYVDFSSGKHYFNPSSEQIYYPKLTITSTWRNRKPTPCLKVEFSIPKLLFQNNVDELSEDELELVIPTLKRKLNEIGIAASNSDIENAEATPVHFSRNILLTNSTATQVIRAISKVAISHRLEFNTRDYKNDGKALYIDNNSYQLCLYDKVQDAFKGSRPATDKDRTLYQQKLLKAIKNSRLPIEIFRFEVRILRKKQLNLLLQKLGLPINPSFRQILNPELATQMLRHHWNLIVPDKSQFLLKFSKPDILTQIINYQKTNRIKLHSAETLAIAYLIHHCREYGFRNLEATLISLYTRRTWYRLSKRYITLINNLTAHSQPLSWVEDIEQALNHYTPLKVSNLEQMYKKSFDIVQTSN